MRITDIFKEKNQTFSFEFFPPKTEEGMTNLLRTIKHLKQFNPDYVSVTYGAMGTTREKTISIVDEIQNRLGITAMAHLTCVGATSTEIKDILNQLKAAGIKNIMALRGDPPQGKKKFVYTPGGFRNATDLIACIKKNGDFCIGAAGYPEGHIEAESKDKDMDFLKMKMDSGANFIVTQLFLDNSHYFRFRELAKKKGVSLRLIPGIMPVTNYQQIYKFTTMCGCTIPAQLERRLYPVRDNKDEISKIGIEYAIKQCEELLRNDAPGLHFYTLNKSNATREVFNSLISQRYIVMNS